MVAGTAYEYMYALFYCEIARLTTLELLQG
jgi:hypothetical protein